MQNLRIFWPTPAMAVPHISPAGTGVHLVPVERRKNGVLVPALVARPAAQYSVPGFAQSNSVTVEPDGSAAWTAALVQEAVVGLGDGLFDGLALWDGLPVELGDVELDDGDELGLELLDEHPARPIAAMMAMGAASGTMTDLDLSTCSTFQLTIMPGQNRVIDCPVQVAVSRRAETR